MSEDVTLRAVTPRDEAFLLRLYATTRPEVAAFGWDEAEQRAFLTMQFQMQTRSYAMQYPTAEQSVILLRGQDAGRVIVDRYPDRIVLTDIAVLAEFRRKGIATTVITRVLEEAARTRRSVDLTVEKTNANAFALYGKLGFEITGEDPIMITMRWKPPAKKGRI